MKILLDTVETENSYINKYLILNDRNNYTFTGRWKIDCITKKLLVEVFVTFPVNIEVKMFFIFTRIQRSEDRVYRWISEDAFSIVEEVSPKYITNSCGGGINL